MTVVSDTTAITTLLKIGREDLLKDILGEVIIPQAVWVELRNFHAELPAFISTRPVTNDAQRLPGTELLGRGEAEAIKLAKEINADLLLTDDRKARAAAARIGIRCAGLLGLAVQAKQTGKVTSVRTLIELIEQRGWLLFVAKSEGRCSP
jgi:predicted nucleic acid-binding protein